MDKGQKYILDEHWILRNDPNYVKKYSAYNVETRQLLNMSSACYTFLNMFSKKAFSYNEVEALFASHGINFDWKGFESVCSKVYPGKLLKEYNGAPISFVQKAKRAPEKEEMRAPVSNTPIEAEIHFTHKCNLKCLHCFQDSSPASQLYNELSADFWIDIFNQFEENRMHNIIISGGEPLSYKYFFEVFNQVVENRNHFCILTNGMLVNKRNFEPLIRKNVSLSISLDGSNAEMHDKLRGQGAFNILKKNLTLLSTHGAEINFSCTLHKYNYLYLRDIIEFSLEFGVKGIVFSYVDLIGRAKENDWLGLSIMEKKQIREELRRLQVEYAKDISLDFSDFSDFNSIINQSAGRYIYCTAGTMRIAISPDGLLYPCAYGFRHKELAIADLRKAEIADAWNDEDKWRLYRGYILPEKLETCSTCALKDACSQKNCRLKGYNKEFGVYAKPTDCMIEQII